MCERVDMYEMIVTYVNETITRRGGRKLTVVARPAGSVAEAIVILPRSCMIDISRWRCTKYSLNYFLNIEYDTVYRLSNLSLSTTCSSQNILDRTN